MARTSFWSVFAACLLASAPAQAAPMEHHDLASLWFLADEIVMADEVSHGTEGADWNETTKYRITRSWKGSLAVGAEIEVFDDAYRLDFEPTWDSSDPEHPRQIAAPVREPRAILFLEPSEARMIAEGQYTRSGLWEKVPSGMRILAGGKVYRFTQVSNPGAYEPTPQGDDPDDVLVGNLAPVEPIDLAAFERELADAKARAERAVVALALTDAAARTRALLDLLPPPRAFPPRETVPQAGFPADALSERLRDEIAGTGDLDAFLDAMSRDVVASFRTWDGRLFLEPDRSARGERLLEAALDATRPRGRRDAALRVLADMPPWPAEDDARDPLVERLAPLLTDADRWIRAAAVDAVSAWLGNARWKWTAVEVLQPALETETDADVLVEYAWDLAGHQLKSRLLDPHLGRGRRQVLAARPGPREPSSGAALTLGYEFICRDAQAAPYYLTFTAAATAANGTVSRSTSAETVTATSTTGAGRGIQRFVFDPPLAAGSWQVALEADLAAQYQGPAIAHVESASLAVVVP